jgi:hypothetical protein
MPKLAVRELIFLVESFLFDDDVLTIYKYSRTSPEKEWTL